MALGGCKSNFLKLKLSSSKQPHTKFDESAAAFGASLALNGKGNETDMSGRCLITQQRLLEQA